MLTPPARRCFIAATIGAMFAVDYLPRMLRAYAAVDAIDAPARCAARWQQRDMLRSVASAAGAVVARDKRREREA